MMKKNCLIIAGEKSAEEHALSFFPELLKRTPECHYWGVAGDELKSLGVEVIYHLNQFSSMGFSDVILKIPFYYKALNYFVDETKKRETTSAILIDFQDFNLRLAQRLAQNGIYILYYVAPQAWAWKSYRATIIKKCATILYSILPFEKEWFESRGVSNIVSVLHPLVLKYKYDIEKHIKRIKDQNDFSLEDKVKAKQKIKVLLLPGSRKSEIIYHFYEFKKSIEKLSQDFNLEVGLLQSRNLDLELYHSCSGGPISNWVHCHFLDSESAHAFQWADMAIATSGTVTLACALFSIPTVVCYKTSLLNEFIFYSFINYNGYISLPNLAHNREVFKELKQDEMNSYQIAQVIKTWLTDLHSYETIKRELIKTYQMMSADFESPEVSMSQIIKREKTIHAVE